MEASGYAVYVNNANSVLRPLKNHGLIVFILTYTPWLLCHGFADQ